MVASAALGSLGPITWIDHMLSQPFVARAFESGGLIAAACGLVGYFLVIRSQAFAGDALSHVAFTGALAALAAGVDLRLGLFAACIAFGAGMAVLGPRGRPDDVVIGNAMAWVLGLGALFLSLYATRSGSGSGGVSVLFGSIFGITESESLTALLVAVGVLVAGAAIARPLLFASLDEAVAAGSGVPVRALGMAFLVLVGVTAGEATQAVGSLLLLGLLVAPAATAHAVVSDPWRALALSVALAVAAMWAGLGLAYAYPTLPASFAVLSVSTGCYILALAGRRAMAGRRRPAGA